MLVEAALVLALAVCASTGRGVPGRRFLLALFVVTLLLLSAVWFIIVLLLLFAVPKFGVVVRSSMIDRECGRAGLCVDLVVVAITFQSIKQAVRRRKKKGLVGVSRYGWFVRSLCGFIRRYDCSLCVSAFCFCESLKCLPNNSGHGKCTIDCPCSFSTLGTDKKVSWFGLAPCSSG